MVVFQRKKQRQLVAVAFFFVFKKKKTTTMRQHLLLWWCCNEEGHGNKPIQWTQRPTSALVHRLLLLKYRKEGDDSLLLSPSSM
jgi:hypothetical protein